MRAARTPRAGCAAGCTVAFVLAVATAAHAQLAIRTQLKSRYEAELTRAYSVKHGSRRLDAAYADDGSDASMVERARLIVSGHDPVVTGAKGAGAQP